MPAYSGMRHARVAADGQRRVVERLSQYVGQQAADRHAVADDGDDPAVVFARDPFQRGGGAAAHVAVTLGAREVKVLGAVEEKLRLAGLLVLDIGEETRLPGPDVDLAQVEERAQLHRPETAQRVGGEHRAVKIAGVQRVELHAAEALGQRVELPQAQRGDVAVPVALHGVIDVALRLGVSDQIDFCHNKAFLT